MQQRGIHSLGDNNQMDTPITVNCTSVLLFTFGLAHRSKGCGIDYQVGMYHLGSIADIKFCRDHPYDFKTWRHHAYQFVTNLTFSTRNQYALV